MDLFQGHLSVHQRREDRGQKLSERSFGGSGAKKISAPDGTELLFMDITLKAVTPATFTILSETLLKNAPSTRGEKKP